MTDLTARAFALNAVVRAVDGKVTGRSGNVMQIEIPVDRIKSAITRLGAAGFSATMVKRPAVYRYDVDLRPHSEATPHAAAIAITAPTPRFGG